MKTTMVKRVLLVDAAEHMIASLIKKGELPSGAECASVQVVDAGTPNAHLQVTLDVEDSVVFKRQGKKRGKRKPSNDEQLTIEETAK